MSEPKDGTFDAEYLRSILKYDPDTGLWWWLRRRSGKRAPRRLKPAGSIGVDGRRTICIDYRTYYSNRLAWLYMTGEWPSAEVDHKDRDNSNDKWSNLRLATRLQQEMNKATSVVNKSGATGVYEFSRDGKWYASITVNGKRIFLGSFHNFDDAVAAREKAELKYFGEFAPKPRPYTGKDLFK